MSDDTTVGFSDLASLLTEEQQAAWNQIAEQNSRNVRDALHETAREVPAARMSGWDAARHLVGVAEAWLYALEQDKDRPARAARARLGAREQIYHAKALLYLRVDSENIVGRDAMMHEHIRVALRELAAAAAAAGNDAQC